MKKWLIPAVLLLIVSTNIGKSYSQTNTPYTLKQCIDYGLVNNPSSTIYQNEVKISRQKTLEFLSPYLPQINGSVSFDDNFKRQTSIIPAGAVGNPTDIKVQFGTQYNTTAFMQVDQALFDQTMIYASPGIKGTNEVADIRVLKNNEDLIYNTAIAYYQVLVYSEQAKLLEQNKVKFEDLLKILQLQLSKGAIKKIDVDRVTVNYNNILSQINLLQTNRELALNNLKNAMGMTLEEKLVIVDSVNTNIQIVMPETTTFNYKSRLDYRLQDANISLLRVDMGRRKTSFLPTLSFYARYGAQSFGNNFGQSFNNWFDYGSIGLKLNIPIFSGLRRHSQYMQSKFTLINNELNLKMNVNQMKLQQQSALTKLLNSFSSVNTNKDNLTLAKEVFDNTTLQYQQGAASLADFLNADYSYKEAQTNYTTSLLNFLSARVEYEKAQGTLINYINTL
jgi:outer membrane protein